jgi:hypothetical protein
LLLATGIYPYNIVGPAIRNPIISIQSPSAVL